MMTRLRICFRATAARRLKKYSSMWRAAGGAARPYDDRQRYRYGIFIQSRCRDGSALLVSVTVVVAAHSRSDLLANRANADVGFSAGLHFAERRIFCSRQRSVHRLGAAMGYP